MALINGGIGNDSLVGNNSESDTINGLDGNDTLFGGFGDTSDTLDGGSGVDSMNGGDGSDTYFVDNTSDVCSEAWNDALGGTADTVIASVSYTISGFGIENLTLTGSALTGTGNANNNVIVGNAQNNTLSGLTGNDTLDGDFGFDTFDGGDGIDTVDYRFWNSGLTVNLTDGVASFEFNVGNETLTSIENILAGVGNDSITGSAAANRLEGGGGNDTMDGGDGNDTLIGGAGNDLLTAGAGVDSLSGGDGDDGFQLNGATSLAGWVVDGGAGADVVDLIEGALQLGTSLPFVDVEQLDVWQTVFAGTADADSYDFRPFATIGFGVGQAVRLNAGDGNDVVYTSNTTPDLGGSHVVDGQNGNDTLIGGAADDELYGAIGDDSLTDGAGSDTLGGSSGNDTLTSHAGNDLLAGGSGDDSLVSTAGIDVLVGGAGNDTYDVEASDDVLVEMADGGVDTVRSAAGITLAANIENALLLGSASVGVTGNASANTLTGNGGANTLNGAAGADTMTGGNGNDTYVVDNAGDTISETATLATQIDTVRSSITFTLATQANVEHLVLTGTAAINGTGNARANAITGNTAVNTLTGSTGNDTLDGGGGADSLVGGAGNDTYVVNVAGDKTVETGTLATEIDLVRAGLSWTLTTNVENLTLTGTGAFTGTGNLVANVLTGNTGANTLLGLAGADRLDGGAGNDLLDGGIGSDTLVGGTGADTFRFANTLSATSNVDAVSGFARADDRFLLDDAVFAGIGAVGALATGAFRSGTAALEADDRIIYNKAQGKLYFDADGFGGAAQVLFATVAINTDIRADDFFIG